MDKIKEYIKEMDKIVPRQELVEQTIQKIRIMENQKNQSKVRKFNLFNFFRKIIIGILASLTMTTTCFAGYIIVSGNTKILEKIGIKLSKNYENKAEFVYDTVVDKNFELTLESVSVDESFVITKYTIISTEEITENLKLKTSQLKFDRGNENYVILDFEENQAVKKNEDGSCTLYNIYFIKGIKNTNQNNQYAIDEGEIGEYDGDLIDTLFGKILSYGDVEFQRDDVKIKLNIEKIENENNEIITEASKQFEFKVNREKHTGNSLVNSEKVEEIRYNNLDIRIPRIVEGDFGTNIMITVSEDSYKPATNNDIEYLDIIVRDENDNILNVMGKYEDLYLFELFNVDHDDGRAFDMYFVLDTNVTIKDYKFEIVKKEEKQRDFSSLVY